MLSSIFNGGLVCTIDNDALKEALSSYGEIVKAKIVNNHDTGKSRDSVFPINAIECWKEF